MSTYTTIFTNNVNKFRNNVQPDLAAEKISVTVQSSFSMANHM